jgi:hypothetical protein
MWETDAEHVMAPEAMETLMLCKAVTAYLQFWSAYLLVRSNHPAAATLIVLAVFLHVE